MNLDKALELIRPIPDYPKPGILFQDITPLLANADGFATVIAAISELCPRTEYAIGIEARGFIFASALAQREGMGFVPIRKSGKLPGQTYSRSYGLEYGKDTVEIHCNALPPQSSVVLIDDVLATGGTINAAIGLVSDAACTVSAVIVLLEIADLNGRARIREQWPDMTIHSLLQI